jgi:DNA-binding transcriptional ArsR family regulator
MIDPELIPLVALRFKALGEPARLALLVELQGGERSVSDLVASTGRTQPNVSQHLKEMVRAGLVEARREGARVYYRICDPYLNRICDAVCRSVRDARDAWFSRSAGGGRRSSHARRERAAVRRGSSGRRGQDEGDRG